MKYLLSIVFASMIYMLSAQTETIPYQSILSDNDNTVLNNIAADLRVNVREGSDDGVIVYTELHQIVSGDNGEIYLQIGLGTPEFQNFNEVDWRNATFIDLQIKPVGFTNYMPISNRQLLSVPYALFALKVNCEDGCPGEQGEKGADGAPGPIGATGAPGPPGFPGATGATGQSGPEGESGVSTLSPMDNVPTNPESGRFYIDDGTNRNDGIPGFRYFDGNVWLDL